jgi:hypothetical protein
MATYSRTLRLNDGIISVQRANLSQYSIVSAYIYTSKGASPKTLHSQDRLQKPDGTLLNANATFFEAEVNNSTNPPQFAQVVLDTSSSFDGSSPLTIHQYDLLVPFVYPGVADTIKLEETAGTYKEGNIGLSLEGPVRTEVQATAFEFLQSSSNIASSDYNLSNGSTNARALWAPNAWASIQVEGFCPDATNVNRPNTHIETVDLTGYRLVDNFGDSTSNKDLVRFNNNNCVKQFNDLCSLRVSQIEQGPESPIGNVYVLDISIVPFVSLDDGTLIYKKSIIVSDTIPSQTGLAYT